MPKITVNILGFDHQGRGVYVDSETNTLYKDSGDRRGLLSGAYTVKDNDFDGDLGEKLPEYSVVMHSAANVAANNPDETDNISFAMQVLCERVQAISDSGNAESIKIMEAVNTLNDIRGGKALTPPDEDVYPTMRERLYRDFQRECDVEYIRTHIVDNEHLNTHGLSGDEIMDDLEMIQQILRRYTDAPCNNWDNMADAINNGIRDILERREGANGKLL